MVWSIVKSQIQETKKWKDSDNKLHDTEEEAVTAQCIINISDYFITNSVDDYEELCLLMNSKREEINHLFFNKEK